MARMDKNEILNQVKIAAMGYPLKAMSDDLGKAYSTLSNELDHRGTAKLGFMDALGILDRGFHGSKQSRLAALEAADMIEAGLGRIAFSIPETINNNAHPLMKKVASLAKEFSEAVSEISTSIEDGHVSRKEAENCLTELKDLLTVTLELRMYFKQIWGLE